MTIRGKKTVKYYFPLTSRFESLGGNKIMKLFLLGTLHKHVSN